MSGEIRFVSMSVLFLYVTPSFGAVQLFTSERQWRLHVADLEEFDTTATNIAQSIEISIPPGENQDLGSNLTFEAGLTGLSRTFDVRSINVLPPLSRGLVFRDTNECGLGGDRNLSIGDCNGAPGFEEFRPFYEDDDIEFNFLTGPALTAFAFHMIGNEGELPPGSENLIVMSNVTELAVLPTLPSSAGTSGSNFLGIVSDVPFDRIVLDEAREGPNVNGDDIAVRDFRFALYQPVGLPGDSNGDGLVNMDDLNDVRNHFGATGPDDGTLDGDAFPFDGLVNIGDLNLVRNNFGATAAPELSSFVLLGVVNQLLSHFVA